ncbi:MAG: hypothetical protein RLN62_02755 [Rickettsiales bacterium]
MFVETGLSDLYERYGDNIFPSKEEASSSDEVDDSDESERESITREELLDRIYRSYGYSWSDTSHSEELEDNDPSEELELQFKKAEILRRAYTRLEESQGREYGFQFLRKIDEYYIVMKMLAESSFLITGEELKDKAPKVYKYIKETGQWLGDKIRNGVELVDNKLSDYDQYKRTKPYLGDILNEISQESPEIVQDIMLALLIGGVAEGALSGTTKLVKGTKSLVRTESHFVDDAVKLEAEGSVAKVKVSTVNQKIDFDVIRQGLVSKDPVKIAEILKMEVNWDINPMVFEKIPAEARQWNIANEGIGIKFQDSNHARVSIRVMKASPISNHASQRVDYVKVTYNGDVIGRDGVKIPDVKGGKTSHLEQAHIPLNEWLKWKEIGKK